MEHNLCIHDVISLPQMQKSSKLELTFSEVFVKVCVSLIFSSNSMFFYSGEFFFI